MAVNFLGFTIMRTNDEVEEMNRLKSIVPENPEGANIIATGEGTAMEAMGSYGAWVSTFGNEGEGQDDQTNIYRYRSMSMEPMVDKAVDIIVNEAVSNDHTTETVNINLDKIEEYSESMKDKIRDEFEHIIDLMNFNHTPFETFKRYYVDGRMQYQVVVDKEKAGEIGISKLVYLEPHKLKRHKVVNATIDDRTRATQFSNVAEFYTYNETAAAPSTGLDNQSVKLSRESVVQVHCGLFDPKNTAMLSYLHKAMVPLNQLQSLENAKLIYVISRAPERRVFYINVGNLPTGKAEQVLKRQMERYKAKIVFNPSTGTVDSQSKHMTMIEDYWLPRTTDGRGTEISTIGGGGNLGEMEEVNHFQTKFYNSLNVPLTRLDPNAGFSIGRSTEITRDEVMLIKFVNRLRRRFSDIFLQLLERQLSLKNVMSHNEFDRIKSRISFEFKSDNHFDELLAGEVLASRFDLLDRAMPYIGKVFPLDFVYKEIMQFDEDDIEDLQEKIQEELKDGRLNPFLELGDEDDGFGSTSNVYFHSTKQPDGATGGREKSDVAAKTAGTTEKTSTKTTTSTPTPAKPAGQ